MAKSEIYKTVNGQKVELSAKEVKNFIMKVNGWTSDEYDKQRYILKNKLRTYEAFTGQQQAQSPVSFMYFEAKAKQRQGANYTPSLKTQRIKSFQSLGSAKAISKAQQSQKVQQKMRERYEQTTMKQFKGLIDNNPVAKKIWETVKDPVKREQALTDFANELKLKIKESNEVEEAQAIPFGETFGSSDEFDFDVSQYV